MWTAEITAVWVHGSKNGPPHQAKGEPHSDNDDALSALQEENWCELGNPKMQKSNGAVDAPPPTGL